MITRHRKSTQASLEQRVEELEQRVRVLDLLLGDDTMRSSRVLSHGQVMALAREVADLTGTGKPYGAVVTAWRTLIELESRGLGRLAGSPSNITGKLAATPLLDPPNAEVLEIGTLFGLFAGGLSRQLARRGVTPSITIVDPFSGAQLQSGRTTSPDRTGTPVTVDVARTNLLLAGVLPGQVRLVTGFSTDPAVRHELADREYGVVVVDGDHSYEGVHADLEWLENVVAPGGIVVLDDFGDAKWPGVERAAVEHLAGPTRLTLLGRVSTSAYLRAA